MLQQINRRVNLVFLGFTFIYLIFVVRLFFVQVIFNNHYIAKAESQRSHSSVIEGKRGDILDVNGNLLATTQLSYLLFAEPYHIEDSVKLLDALKKVFNPSEESLNYFESQLNKKDLFWVSLIPNITPEQKIQMEEYGFSNIGFEETYKRYYPENNLATHILGFVRKNDEGNPQGYYGIEGEFDNILSAKNGAIIQEVDAHGKPILSGQFKRKPAQDGFNVVTTLDRTIQYKMERIIKEGVKAHGAKSGIIIVMNPLTGDLYAIANYPEFDLQNINFEEFKINPAISENYEPGSVIKPFTVAAGLEGGYITPNSTFEDFGPVYYSDYKIDNWNGQHHGVQNIVQLLQKSNNIGSAWLGHLIGSDYLLNSFKEFGFGKKTTISLEGESAGIMKPAAAITSIDLANMSFGQGIALTPLQVLTSFNAFANDGKVMRPRLIKNIQNSDEFSSVKPLILSTPISAETAETMDWMLYEAVKGGEAKFFNITDYKISGKTGTAQVPIEGGYAKDITNTTFVGYLTESKKFSMIVVLEHPNSSIYAAETAVPVWMDAARELIDYFNLPPDF
jgi:stage V sporulation protein D (sporulation-specific penicillin-binding protein)